MLCLATAADADDLKGAREKKLPSRVYNIQYILQRHIVLVGEKRSALFQRAIPR